MGVEIERKWLVKRLPEKAKLLGRSRGEQTYLASNPTLRLRRCWTDRGEVDQYLTLKSSGNLSRFEFEIPLQPGTYDEMLKAFLPEGVKPISKDNRYYDLREFVDPADLGDPKGQLRIDVVDRGDPDREFMYAEVEFTSEEAAKRFEFPFPECEPIEVTDDPTYKMVNYWYRSRSNITQIQNGLTSPSGMLYTPTLDAEFRNVDGIRQVISGREDNSMTVGDVVLSLLKLCDPAMHITAPDPKIMVPCLNLEYDSFGPPRFDHEFTTLSLRTSYIKVKDLEAQGLSPEEAVAAYNREQLEDGYHGRNDG